MCPSCGLITSRSKRPMKSYGRHLPRDLSYDRSTDGSPRCIGEKSERLAVKKDRPQRDGYLTLASA
jgi:hypothetical protein